MLVSKTETSTINNGGMDMRRAPCFVLLTLALTACGLVNAGVGNVVIKKMNRGANEADAYALTAHTSIEKTLMHVMAALSEDTSYRARLVYDREKGLPTSHFTYIVFQNKTLVKKDSLAGIDATSIQGSFKLDIFQDRGTENVTAGNDVTIIVFSRNDPEANPFKLTNNDGDHSAREGFNQLLSRRFWEAHIPLEQIPLPKTD